MFEQAIMHARGHDLEWEARGNVAMGALYTKILKMHDKGVLYHKKAVELGMALLPRVVRS